MRKINEVTDSTKENSPETSKLPGEENILQYIGLAGEHGILVVTSGKL